MRGIEGPNAAFTPDLDVFARFRMRLEAGFEDFFAGSSAVNIGVVEERNARDERGFKGFDGLFFNGRRDVGRLVDAAHAHAAKGNW